MKLKRIVTEGERLPHPYYGNSYRIPERREMVMHIIPINYLVRAFKHIEYFWNRFRAKPTWLDRQGFKMEERLHKNIGIKIREEASRIVDEMLMEQRKEREGND